MSLFKQIAIIMSVFLFIVIIAVMGLNINTAKKYAQEELYDNAQNTAASLSLSLANAQGDVAAMSTMINAVFDGGYYQEIVLHDMQGNEIFSRVKENTKSHLPEWFLAFFPLEVSNATANISAGWQPIGILSITPLREVAQQKLYENLSQLLQTFLLIAIITLAILYLLLSLVLRSLKRVQEQAEAISKNDFIITDDIPYTTEFKDVTLSMNKMVLKVKEIFEKESQAVRNYHNLLYTDTLSGFGNRKYFDMELKNLIHAEDVNANGILMNFFFDGIAQANTVLGHQRVDNLIQTFANVIDEATQHKNYAMKVRLDGTKFSVIFPVDEQSAIHIIAQKILDEANHVLTQFELQHEKSCSIKISIINYNANDTVTNVTKKIEESLQQAQSSTIFSPENEVCSVENLEEERKSLLRSALKNQTLSLALQSVFDNQMNVFHHEAFVRLMDAKGSILPAGTFMPLVSAMNLDVELDEAVISKALDVAEQFGHHIAINLSIRFIKNAQALKRFMELSAKHKVILSFEISNQDILNNLDATINFAKMLENSVHSIGIDKFSAMSTNLEYLQTIKPTYIKVDCHYLRDMLCQQAGVQNNALHNIMDSLDTKIIATAVEDETIKHALEEVGIEYFQGSLLAKAKML